MVSASHSDGISAHGPLIVANYLQATYPFVEDEVGASQTTDFITGPLYNALTATFQGALPAVANLQAIEPAPLAVQGSPPASGLFSFDEYSSPHRC